MQKPQKPWKLVPAKISTIKVFIFHMNNFDVIIVKNRQNFNDTVALK